MTNTPPDSRIRREKKKQNKTNEKNIAIVRPFQNTHIGIGSRPIKRASGKLGGGLSIVGGQWGGLSDVLNRYCATMGCVFVRCSEWHAGFFIIDRITRGEACEQI